MLLLVSLATRMGREQARQCLCRLAHSAAELQGRGLHVRVSCCSIIPTADACRSFVGPATRAGLALQLQQACGERCCGHAFPLLWLTAKLCTKTISISHIWKASGIFQGSQTLTGFLSWRSGRYQTTALKGRYSQVQTKAECTVDFMTLCAGVSWKVGIQRLGHKGGGRAPMLSAAAMMAGDSVPL